MLHASMWVEMGVHEHHLSLTFAGKLIGFHDHYIFEPNFNISISRSICIPNAIYQLFLDLNISVS